METLVNRNLKNTYLTLINNLSEESRLDIIAQLSVPIKKKIDLKPRTATYYSGIWDSENSAEEIIDSIRRARVFNRQIDL